MRNAVFGERLRSLRGNKKKAEFARFLGVSAPSYQKYEDGMVPRADCLSAMADQAQVSVRWLLGGPAEIHLGAPRETALREQAPSFGDPPLHADRSIVERLDRMEAQLQTLTQLLGATLAASVSSVAGGEQKRKAG